MLRMQHIKGYGTYFYRNRLVRLRAYWIVPVPMPSGLHTNKPPVLCGTKEFQNTGCFVFGLE